MYRRLVHTECRPVIRTFEILLVLQKKVTLHSGAFWADYGLRAGTGERAVFDWTARYDPEVQNLAR